MASCSPGLWSHGLRSVVVPVRRPKEGDSVAAKTLQLRAPERAKCSLHSLLPAVCTQSSAVPQAPQPVPEIDNEQQSSSCSDCEALGLNEEMILCFFCCWK